MKRFFGPGLVLFFLAPITGEMLCGSSPPAQFFSVFGLLFLPVLYGGGAILVRELTLRWGKGWPTMLVLGAAYGIIEEGLEVKSFFNPYWQDVGALGAYGRWAGVNWVWTFELTIYHAVVSIAIPILLTGLLFPARRDKPWVGRKTLITLGVLLLAEVVVGALFFGGAPRWWTEAAPYFAVQAILPLMISPTTAMSLPVIGFTYPYYPAAWLYLATVLVVIGLVVLAKKLPRGEHPPEALAPPVPMGVGYYLAGAAGVACILLAFVASHVLQARGIAAAPLLVIATAAATVTALILLARRAHKAAPRVPRAARAFWFYVLGLVGIFGLFFISWGVPNLPSPGAPAVHPIVAILAVSALVALVGWKLWRMARRGAGWSDGRAVALIAGAVTLFILFSAVHEFKGNPSGKNMHGMLLVGIAWTVFLVGLGVAVRRRGRTSVECGVRNAE